MVFYFAQSLFLHSLSVPGHGSIMLTFSPYSVIWSAVLGSAHSHLFIDEALDREIHYQGEIPALQR
jgi:hypothetical protein